MSGRILYIFTTKSLIYATGGGFIGLLFFYLFSAFGMTIIGMITAALFALIGYGIAMLKIPDSSSFEVTRKLGGEKIDDVILRYFKFKNKKKRIYMYTTKEEIK